MTELKTENEQKNAVELQEQSEKAVSNEEQAETAQEKNQIKPYKNEVSACESEKENKKTSDSKGKDEDGEENEQEIYEEMLPDLAKLMNVSLSKLKDEFFLFQIRKLMGKLGKLIVRFNLSEAEIEKILYNSNELEMGEVVISPAYLPVCGRKVKKHRMNDLYINTLIDFPFGENSFKSKLNNVRESIRAGVDGVSVMMPNLLATPENIKIFKKQVKKIGRCYKYNSNVVINATDLSEQEIQRVFKLITKTKLKGVVFAFGEATLEEVKSKITIANKLRGVGEAKKSRRKNKLSVKNMAVIANVDRADAINELFKLHVDKIITPYADQIGEELIKRFKIKSIKLR